MSLTPEPESEGRQESESCPAGGSICRRTAVQVGVGAFGLGYAGAIGYPIYRYLNTPVAQAASAAAVREVSLPDAQKLAPGTALMFQFGTQPAMLIHHQDGTWNAFSAVCTHLGCTVKFEPEKNRIHCACHGGVYNPYTGAAVSGPPPRGLTVYDVEVNDGNVVVTRR